MSRNLKVSRSLNLNLNVTLKLNLNLNLALIQFLIRIPNPGNQARSLAG